MASQMIKLCSNSRQAGLSGSAHSKAMSSLWRSTTNSSKTLSIWWDFKSGTRKTSYEPALEWFCLLRNPMRRILTMKAFLSSTRSHLTYIAWSMLDSFSHLVVSPKCTRSFWMESLEHVREPFAIVKKYCLSDSAIPWKHHVSKFSALAVKKYTYPRHARSTWMAPATEPASRKCSRCISPWP